MKTASSLLAISTLALCSLAFVFAPAFPTQASDDAKTPAPVVVELFTSEGCSSCPPADALLMKFQNAQPIQGAKVIAIEEHVDYWNHDGWTDPYSSADWTQRQVDYVLKFKDKTPYTPQMIVDGQTQMTGAQEPQARDTIQQAANQPQTDIIVAPGDSSSASQDFKVRVGKLVGNTDKDSAEVWLAITESGLESFVKAGENAGRDLRHAPVLRSLHKIGTAKGSGDTTFDSSAKVKFKPEWKRQNLQIVVFVQDRKSMRILGAAAVSASA
jgi:hypothetical protein